MNLNSKNNTRFFLSTCMAFTFAFSFSENIAAKPGMSKSPTVLMSADEYNSHADGTADLSGNVKVIKGTDVLTCDKAHVNNTTGQVEAEGHVVFITNKDFIRAQSFKYNFISKTGIIGGGVIQTGQETIEGEEINKMGEDNYIAKNASYTSCVNCPASWKISGSKIDASVGGYAYVSNPLFRLYGVPVLWLPWIAIPIKSERQSGMLPPTFVSSGNSGAGYGESYFLNISKSKDATFSAVYYNLRGLKESLEYRFASDKTSGGIFQANLINDRYYPTQDPYTKVDPRYALITPRASPPDLQRFSIRYSQHVDLPEGYSSNIGINAVRDTTYLYDFPLEMPGAGDPALENRISLTKDSENSHTSVDVDMYQNLLVVDPLAQNTTAVHRIPEIRYSLIPLHVLGKGLLGVDVNYDNFMGAGQTFYDPTGSTSFNSTSGSIYRTGQRLIVHPTFSVPFTIAKLFDIVPKIEYDEANYQFGYGPSPSASRRYLRGSIDVKTRMTAILNENDPDPKATKYKHEFIPEVSYTVVPVFQQDQHPFFLGKSNQTFQPNYSANQPITEYDNIQFDYRDRLADRNLLTYGMTNKFIRKRLPQAPPKSDPNVAGGAVVLAPTPPPVDSLTGIPVSDIPEYRELIRHTLTESYDISSATQNDTTTNLNGQVVQVVKQPYSDIHSLLVVTLDHFTLGSDYDYYPYQHVANSSETIGVTNSKGDGASLGFTEGYQIYPNYSDTTLPPLSFTALSEAVTGTLFFTTKYLDLSATSAYDILLKQLSSYSLNGLLKPPGKCWGIGLTFTQIYGGPPTLGFTLPIFFGNGKSFNVGKPPGMP